MNEINHQVGIKSSPKEIYQLLTTDIGIAKWWTHETSGAGKVGSVIEFRFNDIALEFQVMQLIPNEKVVWKHQGNMPEAWMGTEIVFKLDQKDGQTFIHFNHRNWTQTSDFLAHCNTKWAVFLLSLKEVAETGVGKPFPNDVQIDHS
jgi:uncharacterized protein YndB with AHSA1/START domain